MDVQDNYWDLILFGLTYEKGELLKKAKGVVKVTHGNYPYKIFNICFLHDMLSQILEILWKGYVPLIKLAGREEGWCDWDTFFEQPFYDADKDYLQALPMIQMEGRVKTLWRPIYTSHFVEHEYEMMCKLYRDWVVLNKKTLMYIQKEYVDLLQNRRVLGCVCRGTDFNFHPIGHPVQPKLSDVMTEVKDKMREIHCDYIYIATEEARIAKQFFDRFPNRVLVNKREYYDEKFYEQCNKKGKVCIEDVALEDSAQLYRYSIEYLSSLVLLAMCKGLIGGNCGASQGALFFADHSYDYWKIFDLGCY